MEVRPGYKQTEVGVIPDDWEVKTLGQIARLRNGYSFRSETYNPVGDFKVVTIANVQDGYMDTAECSRITEIPSGLQPHQKLKLHDILISMTGNVGRVCRVNDTRCLLNQRVGKLLAIDCDDGLLYTLLNQRRFLSAMATKAKGGAQGNLSVADILEFQFPVPPAEPEQRAIATALSDVDALLGGLDRLIAKKRDVRQAAMQQLLTGQTRLPGFHGEWEVKRLGDYVTFLRNGVNSRAELLPEGRVKYLHYGDVHACTDVFLPPAALPCLPDAKAASLDRLRDGDLVFADASEDVAGVSKSVEIRGVGDTEVVSGLHTIAARFDKNVFADGFKGFLQFCPPFAIHLRRLAAGTKVYATNRAHVASVEMRLPTVSEQVAIAAVLSDMDAELTALEARRDKTRDLKQAMMQELLTGKTRLVPVGVVHA